MFLKENGSSVFAVLGSALCLVYFGRAQMVAQAQQVFHASTFHSSEWCHPSYNLL